MVTGNLMKTVCFVNINYSCGRLVRQLPIASRAIHSSYKREKIPSAVVWRKREINSDHCLVEKHGVAPSVPSFGQMRCVCHSSKYSAMPMLVSSSTATGVFGTKDLTHMGFTILPGNNAAWVAQSRSPSQFIQARFKSKKKQTDTEESESDTDGEDTLEEDDFEAPPKFKVMKIHVASMRADAVISHALDVGRNRLEEMFLGSGFLLNGNKMLKKSVKMDTGDYVDVIMEKMDEQLKVKRVKVIKIYPERTGKDKFVVKVRVWKAPFLVAKPDSSQRDS